MQASKPCTHHRNAEFQVQVSYADHFQIEEPHKNICDPVVCQNLQNTGVLSHSL